MTKKNSPWHPAQGAEPQGHLVVRNSRETREWRHETKCKSRSNCPVGQSKEDGFEVARKQHGGAWFYVGGKWAKFGWGLTGFVCFELFSNGNDVKTLKTFIKMDQSSRMRNFQCHRTFKQGPKIFVILLENWMFEFHELEKWLPELGC